MNLSVLLESVSFVEQQGKGDPEVLGISYDSRAVKPGWLFVAVSGYQVDGAEFITQAISNGAVAVVSEQELSLGAGVAHVQVAHSRRALAELANAYFGDLSRTMPVIGVTGTNGKTTTSYMIRDMLRESGLVPGLLGTVAYEIGERSIPAARTTPEALDIHSMFLQMKEAGCNAVVMEVSSHALALNRVHGIQFKVGVFTNLTQDHLDYHTSMENYFDVKAQLFQGLDAEQGASAVVNMDDPWGRKLINDGRLPSSVVSYGFDDTATVRASKETIDTQGTRFEISTPWGHAKVHLNLLGRFNIHNALAALAAGGACGLDLSTMVQALEKIQSIPGRLELVENRKGKKIFVDYAHTDDALRNVLTTLREICKGRLIVVFGCGGNRDQGKRFKMGRVAADLSDYSFVTSDNPRDEEPSEIVDEIISGFEDKHQFEVVLDRREAIEKAAQKMGRKDILLVAGKGHETYQEFRGTVVPFDDRETVRELIG